MIFHEENVEIVVTGCGRLHCGLCAKSASNDGSFESLSGQLLPRRLVYCPSFYTDSLEADLQEVRGQDAGPMPAPFFPRCIQGTFGLLIYLSES